MYRPRFLQFISPIKSLKASRNAGGIILWMAINNPDIHNFLPARLKEILISSEPYLSSLFFTIISTEFFSKNYHMLYSQIRPSKPNEINPKLKVLLLVKHTELAILQFPIHNSCVAMNAFCNLKGLSMFNCMAYLLQSTGLSL